MEKKVDKRKKNPNARVSDNVATCKANLLIALEKSFGVVNTACKLTDVCRRTFYNYYNSDDDFKEKVDEIQNIALDFAESQIFENIKNGKEASLIFYLKCKGKSRGYVERIDQNINITNQEVIFDFGVNVIEIKNKLAIDDKSDTED